MIVGTFKSKTCKSLDLGVCQEEFRILLYRIDIYVDIALGSFMSTCV